MKAQYREGPEAKEHFKRVASALFQVKKDGRKQAKKRLPKKSTSRKSSGSDKG